MLLGLIFAPVLWCLGFGSAGVVQGSIAAGVQAALYGAAIPAGGLFAFMQSAGAIGIMAF
ncbi:hypothetical protein T484DRAFT_1963242 [Baffinella frigidus]|nr:hypothetical protein T484DRAFT_1963242 [Cryptophyta sp. CCMP2293]|eukprot:CAMPEP_0180148262 /NCGR_PEP_ID=MMETSP0986-20121125/19865_1 /TAXON_ID=697907 /ORGANISM="non described non described, Strain CCMP2293" /LENGTH=59 /DNA_ID=CAMNT_0022094205 /DNA_START=40 /DNA_END=219 /DNA_ORIENTATION=+